MALGSADSIKGLIFLMGAGALFVYRGLRAHKQLRAIQDTARSKLESAPQGLAEFEGFAWPQNQRFELFGGDHAVYYTATLQVEKTEGSGKNRRKVWRTVDVFQFFEPFFLLDPTGLAVINPQEAEWNMDAPVTRLWRSIKTNEQAFFLEKIFHGSAAGFPPSGGLASLFAKKFRVVENVLRVGNPLYVKGEFHTRQNEANAVRVQGLTDFFDKVINAEARALKNVSATLDQDKDGRVSAEESRKGYAFAGRLAIKNAAVANKEEREFTIHGEVRSSGAHKLMIADCHETYLVQRMSRSFKFHLGIGSVMMIAGLSLGLNPAISSSQNRTNAAKSPVAVVAETNSPATALPRLEAKDVTRFHNDCYGGQLPSCKLLIDQAQAFGLTKQYLEGYQKQACRLGDQSFCKRDREPASK